MNSLFLSLFQPLLLIRYKLFCSSSCSSSRFIVVFCTIYQSFDYPNCSTGGIKVIMEWRECCTSGILPRYLSSREKFSALGLTSCLDFLDFSYKEKKKDRKSFPIALSCRKKTLPKLSKLIASINYYLNSLYDYSHKH